MASVFDEARLTDGPVERIEDSKHGAIAKTGVRRPAFLWKKKAAGPPKLPRASLGMYLEFASQ